MHPPPPQPHCHPAQLSAFILRLLPSTIFILPVAFLCLLASTTPAIGTPSSDIKAWPLFYYASDPVTSETRTDIFWPLYACQKTPAYTVNEILSFPQTYPTQYPSQFYLLWPLSGLRTGHGHDAWFFPFLWSGDDHFALFPVFWYGTDYFSIFPLFYASGGAGDHTLNIAILQHNSWGANDRLHALWPLAWYYSHRTHGTYTGLLPLFWHAANDNPESDGHKSSFNAGGVLLLNWWYRYHSKDPKRKEDKASDGIFPVFYRSCAAGNWDDSNHSGTSASDKFWLLPYWQSHSRHTEKWHVPGRVENRAKTDHALFPVWWNWSRTEEATTDSGNLFFPFWWASAKTVNGEVTESAKFLVPVGAHFFKKDEYDTQNLLGPVLNRTANHQENYVRYDAFFPLFSMTTGQTRSGGHLFPLAGWETQHGKYSNLWYLFPLGWCCESQEEHEYRVDNDARFWALHETEDKPFVNDTDCRSGPRRTVAFYPFAWSTRQADKQENGLLPFWWQETWRSGPNVSTDTWILPLLGSFDTTDLDGKRTYTRQDYLLSILAWGRGEQYQLRRFFPLYSYQNSYGRREIWSLLLPFYYETWRDQKKLELHNSSEISIPFAFLPLYGSRIRQNDVDSANRESWFFPFYSRSAEKTAARDVEKLSVLWPFWNGEWENGETRIRGLGGVTNFYEKDANGFVEQRLLYRLFTRRTRSWFAEHELMPFYSSQEREDGSGYWKFLGGLFGHETRNNGTNYLRLFFIPIPAGNATQPDTATLAQARENHAELALHYLKHNRHDRAAIEFTLAGSARANDRDFHLAAAKAYLAANVEAVGKELRSSIPSSLEPLGGKGGYCDSTAVHANLRTLAIKHFENAITLGADKPDTLRKIARAYQDMGELDTAMRKLEESDTLQPVFSTGMERLNILSMKIVGQDTAWNIGARPDKPHRAEYCKQWKVLLAELQARYPNSPMLALCEAEAPTEVEETHAELSSMNYLQKENAFTPNIIHRLALYERGAVMQPGLEEAKYLEKDPAARLLSILSRLTVICCGTTSCNNSSPAKKCAELALAILNRQVELLLDDKKLSEAEALFPRIRSLLPRACTACANPTDRTDQSDPSDFYSYNSPTRTAMQNLYRLHVDLKKAPLGYIAVIKEWAATLCPHQQKAVEHALESVRFEQQYLKPWRVTLSAGLAPVEARLSGLSTGLAPVETRLGVTRAAASTSPHQRPTGTSPAVAGTGLEKVVHLNFFERYVNLDAILGAPDHCTTTAECVITSPDERQVVLRLGFDHELTAELNGTVVFGPKKRKIAVRDEFTVPVTLKRGENRLKLTVRDDTLAYGFFARLSDRDGRFMEDVAVSAK